MAKAIFAAIGLIGFMGLMACTPEVRHEPVEVKVPVAVQCPEPPVIERPVLPVEYVHYLSPADEKGIGCMDESSFKNLMEMIMRQNLYIKKLEESLKAYMRGN
ncbi:MAG: hypothetical protein FD156_1223 [Nitrospirae bacterium]|nr:MAG: hypothetical protein FD156_1223 [Nitrospirota bacterium]